MNIQLFSDLHLDNGWPYEPPMTGDVIVFAGDVHEYGKAIDWLQSLKTSKPVLFVPGNHEFYSRSSSTIEALRKQFSDGASRDNIHVLDNRSVEINGVMFHGTTLWTSYQLYQDPEAAKSFCTDAIADYFHINVEENFSVRKLTPDDTVELHRAAIKWLRKSLSESRTKTNVVISHHAPSAKSIANLDDPRCAAYASDLDKLIRECQPDIWLHGHTHRSYDYKIGNTRIVCNARGHVHDALQRNQNYCDEKLVLLDASV